EHTVEPGDPEDLDEVGRDRAELEPSLSTGDFTRHLQQHGKHRAGHGLDFAEVQKHVCPSVLVDELHEVLANLLDEPFVDEKLARKGDDENTLDILNEQARANGLGHSCVSFCRMRGGSSPELLEGSSESFVRY